MNVYDSDRMAGLLLSTHYKLVPTEETADLIIVNTCAIRSKAEQKVFSYLGRLEGIKHRKPDLIIAVGGCVAQQEGEKIIKRMPGVDLVFGTHAIDRLPGLIDRVRTTGGPIVDVEMSAVIVDTDPSAGSYPDNRISRFVTILRGCDNYCPYCVVPHVRGREISRRPERIVNEIRSLVEAGVREVTLLGQNVNSYGVNGDGCTFAELLTLVNDIEGLLRIRFTTSHPKDLSASLIRAFGTTPKLCRHIHLPVQSGSNRTLKRMNRRYTREHYLAKIDRLRHHCPDIAITSDFIVGFPGETETDFEASLDLIRTVGFDSLFAFIYSDRPNAPAARFSDKLPESVKTQRLRKLLDLQEGIGSKRSKALEGTIQNVLVDGFSKKQSRDATLGMDRGVQWCGRTSGYKVVNFTYDSGGLSESGIRPGDMLDVRIDRALPHSLWGKAVLMGPEPNDVKGENYAA